MDRILDLFLTQPRRLVALGNGLFSASGFVLIIGLMGRVATSGVAAIKQIGSAKAAASALAPSLAGLYPGLWTWWVPETAWGAMPYLVLACVGVWAALVGRKIERIYH